MLAFLLDLLQKAIRSPRLGRILEKVWQKLTPNLLIRLFIEIVFDLGICSYLQLNFLTAVTSGIDVFSSVLAVVGAVLCCLVPFRTAFILYKLHRSEVLH